MTSPRDVGLCAASHPPPCLLCVQETPAQFNNLKAFFSGVAAHLHRMICSGKGGVHGGHTDKMQKLEEMLRFQITSRGDSIDGQAPVGIVFVKRRITAIALCNYFCRRSSRDGPVRGDVVVRQATQVFKYLARQSRVNDRHRKQLEDEWVHQTKHIRTILQKLRRRETNVLFATSVVEEGVDVEACQFIIAFDGLTTIKSYVQMKGRARQKNAVSVPLNPEIVFCALLFYFRCGCPDIARK